MQTTLMIKDLSACLEVDRKAMAAVHGGEGNQAIGTSEANVQNMAAMANVANGSLFCGPTTIQSDNSFTQNAYNENYAANYGVTSLGLRVPTFAR